MEYWDNAGAILSGHDWRRITRKATKYRPGGVWLDNIFALDTETTSAFLTPEGDIITFDYSKNEKYWEKCEKFGWVYIWMFGVDDVVFYGRTLPELKSFLELLDDLTDHAQKICYVHNLQFDWQFLRGVLKFDSVFARQKRRVLTAECNELHLHFRCSFYLVNMSLDKWAKSARLPVQKLKGDLNYLKLRTPVGQYSALTPQELSYCEHDILVMLTGLPIYRDRYGAVYKIPLTQTGEVRVAIGERMLKRGRWKRICKQLIPHNKADYDFLMDAFFGGDVHGNYHLAGKLLHGVRSCDFASSYPWVMLSEKFPLSYFTRIERNRDQFMYNPDYCYIIKFEALGIESKAFNTFLSAARCKEKLNVSLDNGRILEADYVCCSMSGPDFENFVELYGIDIHDQDHFRILDFRVAVAGYIDEEFCKYILELYQNKTKYKGVPDMYDVYMFCKQLINGLYGDQVQRLFEGDTTWDPETGKWDFVDMTPERFLDKAEKMGCNYPKLYKAIQVGLFIPAYARRNLWELIKALDHQVAYFDTDCVKFIGNDITGVISSYNMKVLRKHYEIAGRLHIDVSELSPADPSGKCHPIGLAEQEAVYEDFKTVGAKKYACREAGGPIEITIAGVPKAYANELKSVDELENGRRFPPRDEDGKRKMIHYYKDEQPALQIGDWIMDNPFGICLQPTGYSVGLTPEYLALIAANMPSYWHFMDFLNGENENDT